jgi:hypothetical protein
MFDSRRKLLRNLVIRFAGLALLIGSWLLIRWLFHADNLRHHQDPTALQFGTALLGFFCFSAGTLLTALGDHIFDEVQISERWARLTYSPPQDRRPGEHPFLAALDGHTIGARKEVFGVGDLIRATRDQQEAGDRHARG